MHDRKGLSSRCPARRPLLTGVSLMRSDPFHNRHQWPLTRSSIGQEAPNLTVQRDDSKVSELVRGPAGRLADDGRLLICRLHAAADPNRPLGQLHGLLPPQPAGEYPAHPPQQLSPSQRYPRVCQSLPAVGRLALAPEVPERLLLRWQRQPVLLQLQHEKPLLIAHSTTGSGLAWGERPADPATRLSSATHRRTPPRRPRRAPASRGRGTPTAPRAATKVLVPGPGPLGLDSLQRRGVKPDSGAYHALVRLAALIPGGLDILMGDGFQMYLWQDRQD